MSSLQNDIIFHVVFRSLVYIFMTDWVDYEAYKAVANVNSLYYTCTCFNGSYCVKYNYYNFKFCFIWVMGLLILK